MKESKLTFVEGFLGKEAKDARKNGNKMKTFDWDKAAQIIKEKLKIDNNLIAEAGLEGDWNYTGGVIFEKGQPNIDDYTFLSSNWAIPTLIINNEEEIPCYTEDENSRFNSRSKWDDISLNILNNNDI
jgi:hypothetical protein